MVHLYCVFHQVGANTPGRTVGRDQIRMFALQRLQLFVQQIVLEITDYGIILHIIAPFMVLQNLTEVFGCLCRGFGKQIGLPALEQRFRQIEEASLFVGGVHGVLRNLDLQK